MTASDSLESKLAAPPGRLVVDGSSDPSRMVRLLIADTQPLFRLGLRSAFEGNSHFHVVAEAATLGEMLQRADDLRPDVVIVDLQFGARDAVSACRVVREQSPETAVVILTLAADMESVVASLLAGAAGYAAKDSPPNLLVDMVDTVARGGSVLDQNATRFLRTWLRNEAASAVGDSLAGLSSQERNILPLIAQGKINREIASTLGLSENTVKTYVSNILQKLQLSRRSELAALITRINVIQK